MNPSTRMRLHRRRGLSLLPFALLLVPGLAVCQPDEPTPPGPPAALEDSKPMRMSESPAPASERARPAPGDECPPKCELNVTLPTNARLSPTISNSVLHARSGATVVIYLENQSSQSSREAATILRFQEAAFVDRNGRPMTTVTLTPGKNEFTVRPYSDGACRAERGGCKYDVINTGDPGRPVLDPHVIIWN